jgi:hypothetical protein
VLPVLRILWAMFRIVRIANRFSLIIIISKSYQVLSKILGNKNTSEPELITFLGLHNFTPITNVSCKIFRYFCKLAWYIFHMSSYDGPSIIVVTPKYPPMLYFLLYN